MRQGLALIGRKINRLSRSRSKGWSREIPELTPRVVNVPLVPFAGIQRLEIPDEKQTLRFQHRLHFKTLSRR